RGILSMLYVLAGIRRAQGEAAMKFKLNSIGTFLVCLLALAACGGGGGGGTGASNSPVLVQSVPFPNTNGLNGNGNIIALSYTDASSAGSFAGFKETLKIYQQDSINPDLLLDLSSVYLGVDTLY